MLSMEQLMYVVECSRLQDNVVVAFVWQFVVSDKDDSHGWFV